MSTPTITPARELPKLPTLDKSRVPKAYGELSPTIKDKAEQHAEMFSKAAGASAEFTRAVKGFPAEQGKDRELLIRAELDGKPDPGRPNEKKAHENIDQLHRKAEAVILATNRLAHEISALVRSEEGEKVAKGAQEGIEEALTGLKDHAEGAMDCLARISRCAGVIESVSHTRKGKGYRAIAQAPERMGAVSVGGQGVDPMVVLAALASYQPRIEQ